MRVSKFIKSHLLLLLLPLAVFLAITSVAHADEQDQKPFRPQVPDVVYGEQAAIASGENGQDGVQDGQNNIEKLDGITKAISDLELSFVQPGKIRQIMVRQGDLVRAGDVLMEQADEIEQVQLKVLRSRASNMLPIDLAKADLSQKRKDLEKMKMAQQKGAITKWEVDHASLAVDTALLTLKLKQFEHDQDKLKLESVLESIKLLTLTSPVEGVVEEITIEEGETVQALLPVIRIVKTHPLQIDLPVPVEEARRLKIGQNAVVGFNDGTEMVGEIITVSSIADAAATTLEVKLEVENHEGRPAGERITVTFP